MPWSYAAAAVAGAVANNALAPDPSEFRQETGPPGWIRPQVEGYLEDIDATFDNRMGMPAYPEFKTIAGFTDPQLAGQEGALGYAGMLPGVTGSALGANLQGLSAYQNPFLGQYGAALPGAVGTLSDYLSGGQPFAQSRQEIGDLLGEDSNPYLGGYGAMFPQTLGTLGQYAGGYTPTPIPESREALGDLISEGPAMDVYGPISRQIYDEGAEYFAEKLAPSIRQDALNAGQYGGTRHSLATDKALDALGESVMESQERLAGDIYGQTLSNRRFGVGMAEDIGQREASRQLSAAGQLQSGLGQMYGQALGARRFGVGAAEDITARERNQALQAASQLQSGLGSTYGQASSDYYRALGMLPQTVGLGMTPYDISMDIGEQQQTQKQRELADEMARFYSERDWELENLQQRGQLLQPMLSLYSQTTQPIYGSPALQGAGLGMAGASLYNQYQQRYNQPYNYGGYPGSYNQYRYEQQNRPVPGDAYMPAYQQGYY